MLDQNSNLEPERVVISSESTVSTTPVPKIPPYFLRTVFLVIVLVLFGVLLGILGSRYLSNPSLTTKQPEIAPTPTSTVTDNILNWKTSLDTQSGTSFQFPANYFDVKLDNGVTAYFDKQDEAIVCQQELLKTEKSPDSPCFKSAFSFNGVSKLSVLEYRQYLDAEKQSGINITPSKYVDTQGRTWDINTVLGEVYNFKASLHSDNVWYTVAFQSGFSSKKVPQNQYLQEMESIFKQLLSTFSVANCSQNDALGMTISLPIGWTCQSSFDTKDNGGLNLQSSSLTVSISDMGRGFGCEGEPNSTIICKTRPLVLSSNFTLNIVSENGIDKEIYGGLGQTGRKTNRWFSITYKDMATKALTPVQKEELLLLLNSLKLSH